MAKNESGANRRTALLAAAQSWAGLPSPPHATKPRPDIILDNAEQYLRWLEGDDEVGLSGTLEATVSDGSVQFMGEMGGES